MSILQKDKLEIKLLATTPERFRGDLAELGKHFSITPMPRHLQYKAYRPCLHGLLGLYLKQFDALLCPSLWYKQDIPWGVVAKKAGVPSIVLQQDVLLPSHNAAIRKTHVINKVTEFWPDLLITHNDISRDIITNRFPDSADKIKKSGIPRMESLWREIGKSNTITVFSFQTWWDEEGNTFQSVEENELWKSMNQTMAGLSATYPEIQVIIKHKWQATADRAKAILSYVPDNCDFTSKGNSIDLISKSKVVVGYCSTTMLESYYLGKPTIILDYGMPEGMQPFENDYIFPIRVKNEHHLIIEIMKHIRVVNKTTYRKYFGEYPPAVSCAQAIKKFLVKNKSW